MREGFCLKGPRAEWAGLECRVGGRKAREAEGVSEGGAGGPRGVVLAGGEDTGSGVHPELRTVQRS